MFLNSRPGLNKLPLPKMAGLFNMKEKLAKIKKVLFVSKKFILTCLDVQVKSHRKPLNGGAEFITRAESTIKGLTIDNIVLMNRDLSYKLNRKEAPKQLKLVEQINKETDVIYMELPFPFPMSNRDLVVKRFFAGNKENADLIKQLGLPEKSHRYFLMLSESTERSEYPEKSKPVRGKILNYTMLEEEDANDKTTLKVTVFTQSELKLSLPKSAMKALEDGMGQLAIAGIFTEYEKCFGQKK